MGLWTGDGCAIHICFFVSLGPLVQTVLDGNAVAKQDDLLFFERLTEKMLPEETYHVRI